MGGNVYSIREKYERKTRSLLLSLLFAVILGISSFCIYDEPSIRQYVSSKLSLIEKKESKDLLLHSPTRQLSDELKLAYKESMGFFDDIPAKSWDLMKRNVKEYNSMALRKDPKEPNKDANLWYQNAWEPNFSCGHERRIGGMGDGPKWVCNPHRIAQSAKEREEIFGGDTKCLIYSVGSCGNFMFEKGIQEFPGLGECEIHIFDPDDYTNLTPPNMTFHHWGIVADGSQDEQGPNFKSLQDTVEVLGHEGRIVDIFKVDCEGCEWETYKDWFHSGLDIRQILVETHYVQPGMNKFFQTIRNEGYVGFHKEPNTFAHGACQEFAFLKLGEEFFLD